jgi:predicted metal-dependent hydrolase
VNVAGLRARIDHWSERLKVEPTQVRIQPMTRKWASCSVHGRVTFSRDLLNQPASFLDYVIAHELLHLRIPNHGKLFNLTLRAHLRGNPLLSALKAQSSRLTRRI